jgi:hypothetical protein
MAKGWVKITRRLEAREEPDLPRAKAPSTPSKDLPRDGTDDPVFILAFLAAWRDINLQ